MSDCSTLVKRVTPLIKDVCSWAIPKIMPIVCSLAKCCSITVFCYFTNDISRTLCTYTVLRQLVGTSLTTFSPQASPKKWLSVPPLLNEFYIDFWESMYPLAGNWKIALALWFLWCKIKPKPRESTVDYYLTHNHQVQIQMHTEHNRTKTE